VAELLHVYHGIHQSGRLPIFFRRCLEAQEAWAYLLPQREGRGASARAESTSRDMLLTRYQFLDQPCPFLQQGLCQIYPFRPFACRMHFSISPPHWCRPSHFQSPYAVRFNLEPGMRVLDALDRLDDRLQIGLSDMLVTGLLELTVNVMRFEPIGFTN
jgi:Fe-S-cluster containining protein